MSPVPETREAVQWCAICGPVRRPDEEGLCPACGASLIVPKVLEQIIAVEKARIMREIKAAFRRADATRP